MEIRSTPALRNRIAGLLGLVFLAVPAAMATPLGSLPQGEDASAEAPVLAPTPVAFTISNPSEPDMAMNRQRLTLDALPDVSVGPFQPNTHLKVCYPKLSNAPILNSAKYVRHYRPFVIARGQVVLAAAPVNDACMSSGFGPRFGRIHKGVDFSARKHSPIHAAGGGVVMEAGWARGYGKMVVINHGNGVYTRYAHLHRINRGIRPGTQLGFGEVIGTMGNTGNSTGVHLHYEVLTGEWGPRKAYGLEAHNPLDFPTYSPARDTVQLTIDVRAPQAITR